MNTRRLGLALVCALVATLSFAQDDDEAPERQREWGKAWSGLTDEQRGSLTDAWAASIEKLQNLSPEQRQKMKEAATELATFLSNTTPEQRQKAREVFRSMREAYRPLSADEKQQLLGNLADHVERLESLTPEQKEKLRDSWERWLQRRRGARS